MVCATFVTTKANIWKLKFDTPKKATFLRPEVKVSWATLSQILSLEGIKDIKLLKLYCNVEGNILNGDKLQNNKTA